MNSTENFINTYEKLNPENRCYILGILQALKYVQDFLDNYQYGSIKKQHVGSASKDKITTIKANYTC